MGLTDVLMQQNWLYGRYRKWWIRSVIQRYLLPFVAELNGKAILEIGCGAGHGAKVLRQFVKDSKITATDVDCRLISTARKGATDPSTIFEIADVTRLPYLDQAYDAVFDFAALHHVPEWKRGLKEIRRVAKVGGRIFLVDSPIESFDSFLGRVARLYTSHPYDEMFSEQEFVGYVGELDVSLRLQECFRPNLSYFVLVAER